VLSNNRQPFADPVALSETTPTLPEPIKLHRDASDGATKIGAFEGIEDPKVQL